ncbi:hypothetical protein CO676_34060, partial [Sinorhizobium sp. BJ1]
IANGCGLLLKASPAASRTRHTTVLECDVVLMHFRPAAYFCDSRDMRGATTTEPPGIILADQFGGLEGAHKGDLPWRYSKTPLGLTL